MRLPTAMRPAFCGCRRNAVSLGSDSGTLACMAGAVAEAYHGEVPTHLAARALRILPHDLGLVVGDFRQIFMADL